MNDTQDPLADAFRSLHQSAPTGCPEPEEIWDAVHGLAQVEQRRAVIEHIAICGGCAQDWRIAADCPVDGAAPPAQVVPGPDAVAANEAPEPAKVVSLADRSTPSNWMRIALPVVAIAAMLAVVFLPQGDSKKPTYRGGPAHTSTANTPTFDPATGFSFPDAGTGARYDLTVFDANLNELHVVRNLQQPALPVSAQLRAKLPTQGAFFWRVTTRAPDGSHRMSPTLQAKMD